MVGAFVILLVTCLVLGIIWLSAGLSYETYTYYRVYMKESVSGLTTDAAVEFNGVNVGTVQDIAISKRDAQLVELLLRIKSSAPVSQGTRAMLNSRGLTGITYLALQDKGIDPRPLTILPGESYPIITTSPSLFVRLDTTLNRFSDNFNRISRAIEDLLNTDNVIAVGAILQNLTTISQQMMPLINTSLDTLQMVTTQTLPATNQTITNIENATRNMVAITADLKQNPAVLIRGKTPPLLGPGEK